MSRLVLGIACLTAIYALVLVSIDPWDLVIGGAAAAFLLWASRRYLFPVPPSPIDHLGQRIARLLPFVVAVIRDIVVGTWNVALVVLHLRPLAHPGIVAIPIGARSATGVAVTSLVMTLSPGACLVDVDWEQGVMLFHVLDAADADAVREEYETFYQRFQRPVFP
jgi:multisubunit Na+/H+ antiporter MnhE subunit